MTAMDSRTETIQVNSRQNTVAIIFIALVVGAIGGYAFTQQPETVIREVPTQSPTDPGPVQDINVTDGQSDLYNYIYNRSVDSVVTVSSFQSNEGTLRQTAAGTGFVYDRNGNLITNQHVIDGADTVDVIFRDGEQYEAEIIGEDAYTDLAVLQIDAEDRSLNPLPLGDSSSTEIGEGVLAIGNPFGEELSLTHGIISQKNRLLPAEEGFSVPNVLQTDAPINPGNSGGPLFDLDGEVIGVNTAIDTTSGQFSGVGFAVPVNTVQRVAPELIETGNYRHSWIGISGVDVTPAIADEIGLEEASGFLVVSVREDGPAIDADIQAGDNEVNIRGQLIDIGGDVIVGIDDQPVRKIDDILNYLARETEPGDTVTLEIIRNGDRIERDVTLQERP